MSRILLYNWKDRANPSAGGAEVYAHEIAQRWVRSGHEVTIFCRRFPHAAPETTDDGVRIVRRGGHLSVYRQAVRFWSHEGRGNYDLVVDAVNTRPFLTPSFVRETPIIALVHQLAREVWQEEAPPIIGRIGRYVLEPRWLAQYRTVPTVAVSESTRDDLLDIGLENVRVVHNGLTSFPRKPLAQKETTPTLIFVGRLVRTKRPDEAIRAYEILKRTREDACLWMIGDGYLRRKLERSAPAGVHFWGAVDESTKLDLLAKAHIALVPGVREGWGLVVMEAAAAETPSIGYRIPGLLDSIVHGRTGLLVDRNPRAMATATLELLMSPDRLVSFGAEARQRARTFSWDRAAEAFLVLAGQLHERV